MDLEDVAPYSDTLQEGDKKSHINHLSIMVASIENQILKIHELFRPGKPLRRNLRFVCKFIINELTAISVVIY